MVKLKDSIFAAFQNLWDILMSFLPKFIVALIIVLVGWLFAWLMRFIIKRVLKAIKLDELSDRIKLSEVLGNIGLRSPLSKIIASIVYWIILMVFIIVATDYLNVEAISSGIKSLIAYVPTIITALVVFLIGMLIATLVKKGVYSVTNSIGLSGAQAISNIVYYLLLVLVAITAMNQAGIETDLITTYLIMIMGSMLIAFAVAYGIASKDIVSNILSSYYGKAKFEVGAKIKIGEITGTIEKVDNMSVIIKDGDKKIVLPSKRLLNEKVEIIN